MNNEQQPIWNEGYRPQKINDCILPAKIKETLNSFVASGNIPHLVLSGSPGVGKTTAAIALCKEMDADYIVINGSLNGNIDTLRNEIKSFAQSLSLFHEGRKFVIIDEADYLNPNSTQPALRTFMEEYSRNCGFIMTCNYKHRIIPALLSRCSVIDFSSYDKSEMPVLMAQFAKRVESILTEENITFDKKVVSKFIFNLYPDMRKVLNELQSFSSSGKDITSAILTNVMDTNFASLVKILKERKFTEMRDWVLDNEQMDFHIIARKLYDKMDTLIIDSDRPSYIEIAARYQHWSVTAADQVINTAAFLTEVMATVSFQ